jgi:hypothetical protein
MSNTNIIKIGPYIELFCSDYVDEPHVSTTTMRSSGEVPQDHSATEENPKTIDSIVERRPSLSSQISITLRSSGEVLQDHSATEENPKTSESIVERRPSLSSQISITLRSSGEVLQDHSATEENSKTSESIVERRPSLSSQISMNEAYRLAIGNKGSLTSPTLTDVDYHLRGMLPVWSL